MSSKRPRSPSPIDKPTKEQENAKKAIAKRARTKTSYFNEHGYKIVIGIFIAVILLAIFSTVFSSRKDAKTTPVIEMEEIEQHNAQKHSFTLGPNEYFNQWKLSDAKKILNTQLANKQSLSYCSTHEESTIIPDKYNFRTAHPDCASQLRNQGNCSASYAITAVSTIADRYCKIFGQKLDLSPQQLLSCDTNFTLGCDGGYISRSFDYAKRHGIVSNDCLPFNPVREELAKDNCPTTKSQCQRTKITDQCVSKGDEGIKREILKNGPVISVIPIFRDFLIYKTGIYRLIDGVSKFQSAHAVKIIGWDVDEIGNDYWIIENSWGESWGEAGFARIYTKQKELYLDEYALAPIIDAPKKPADAEPETPSESKQKIQTETEDLDKGL